MIEAKYEERPDYIRLETEDDIIEIKPIGWEISIKEKDSGEEYGEDFETKDEALNALKEEIDKMQNETGEELQYK